MEVMINSILDWWEYNQSRADPRTSTWPLMQTPLPTMGLTAVYLAILFFGKRVMKNREAFKLNNLIILYNVFLVALNGWIFYEMVDSAINLKMNLVCNDVISDKNNYDAYRIARACWWYYLSKCIEFLDTIFFMLRKKDNQITFLHVFHHSTMFNLWWMGVRWAPGGQSTYSGAINAFVHVIMYSYYAMAAIPALKPYLWWKKYLTMMQLTQFFLIFGSTSLALYETRAGRCNFFEWMGWANLSYMIMMISLFSAFYNKTYAKDKKLRAANESAVSDNATLGAEKSTRRIRAKQE